MLLSKEIPYCYFFLLLIAEPVSLNFKIFCRCEPGRCFWGCARMDALGFRSILHMLVGSSVPQNPNPAPKPCPPRPQHIPCLVICSVTAPIDITVSISNGDLLGKMIVNYLPSWGQLPNVTHPQPAGGHGGSGYRRGRSCILIPRLAEDGTA